MRIFPAIDLYGQKAVRLFKGDYAQMTVYSEDPVSVAKDFEEQGAEYVHVVDLEGAKIGTPAHLDIVSRIAKETSLFVEIGGGIRSMDTLNKYLDCGVNRVILGTVAVTDEAFLKEAVEKYQEKIAVGADIKDGYIAIYGWTEKSIYKTEEFISKMQSFGVKNIICTDISKDGAMIGTNRELYRKLCSEYSLDITASGGVTSIDDIKHLKELGLYGAIIGKAYYTNSIDLKEAIKVAEE